MRSQYSKVLTATASIAVLSGCGGFDTSVGPSKGHISRIERAGTVQGVRVIDVTDQVARQIQAQEMHASFAKDLPQAQPTGQRIGKGDVLSVLIWEAPPAALFGGSSLGSTTVMGAANTTALPEMQVGPAGDITVPYAGRILVQGRSLPEIEREIVRRLSGKAHLPQVAVRLIHNASSQVTVVGEVASNALVPLTPKGERLLDAIARAGGTRQPVDKMMIQLTRGDRVESMPLSDIIANPQENIVMQAGDIVTALFQPFSFTALGAIGRNQEVNFEARGITLSQALGRVVGLEDRRADPKGVFLFRWADPRAIPGGAMNAGQDGQGRVPVIYRIDMKDPATYFAMQSFTMQDKDVLYVSNSPVAEFQRFFGIIASTVLPVLAVNRAL
ncbi:polysaccharide biosynthesis/export family protein [Sphingobium vermicomposti]|uniref:Polysaccharide export outer membrane protein n=1 Tax=Sphingobium vermicomposti TaxID=529005 RepID=A0A846M310_9SPHN|nr:polysaccharide biosynthesis/export family protein [Sphingobium vermicomposti]NIJ15458.1 polysaccharide export outer membrane protein [Sphingobium vermicomposti]